MLGIDMAHGPVDHMGGMSPANRMTVPMSTTRSVAGQTPAGCRTRWNAVRSLKK